MALLVTKTTPEQFVDPNSIITYTVSISNSGPGSETNVTLIDTLPIGLTFEVGSVIIDGTPQILFDPTVGFIVTPLLANGDTIVVTYNVLVNPLPPFPVLLVNAVAVTSVETVQPVNASVTIWAFNSEVTMIKLASSFTTRVNDVITYTINITNIGDVQLDNVVFRDVIPTCQELIPNTFAVDGIVIMDADPNVGVALNPIPANAAVVITFDVRTVCIPCPARFVNQADIEYTIQPDIEGPIEQRFAESNETVVNLLQTSFKQLSREEFLCIPPQKPDVEQIISVLVDIEIVNTRLIETMNNVSLEGQILTGNKLIVEGKLKQKIEYVADLPEQPVHSAEFNIPFSTFLVLPLNLDVSNTNIEVQGIVEDVFTELINCRKIFKNVTFNLTAKFGV